jgi:hypothetical protein
MHRHLISAARGAALALAAIVLAASCSLDSLFVHGMMLAAPERPCAWQGAGALAYRVAWKDEQGFRREAFIAEGEEIAIRVRRGERQGILAVPLWEELQLLPAGALYPYDLEAQPGDLPSADPGRMVLSFASGYAATVASVIAEAGADPWGYPIEKLAAASANAGKDPWDLSPWKAAQAILGGTFRATAFPAAQAAFSLPGGEVWLPESPFCSIEGEAGSQNAKLADGLHLFHSAGQTLAVRVQEGKACLPAALFAR